MNSRLRSHFFWLLIVVLACPLSLSASSGTVTASASAKVEGSATVKAQGIRRMTKYTPGRKVTVRAETRVGAKAHSRTVSQLKAKKALHARAIAELKGEAKTSQAWKVRVEKKRTILLGEKKTLSAKLSAKVKARVSAEATLKAKLEARASAKVRHDKAKSAVSASASGSISISLSFGTKSSPEKEEQKTRTELEKADKEVAVAEEKVEATKKEEAAVQQEVAEKDKEVAAVEAEKVVVEEEIAKIEDTLDEQEEIVKETDDKIEEIVKEEETAPKEEVIVVEAPLEPPDNDFGYTEPVHGCFAGEVMYIEPNSKKLPTDYSKYTVAATVYACEWDIPERDFKSGFPGVEDQVEWFAIRYTGGFRVDTAGKYVFRTNSDDGTMLYIDGVLVVDNNGTHPTRSKTGIVELAAGNHDLVLEYYQGPRYHIALQVYVTPPGGTEGIFSVR